MRATLAVGLALLLSSTATAQSVEPEMQVQRLSRMEYPAVAEDEATIMGADEFYRSRNKVFSVEEVAVIRFVFKGRWYKSADYLAREKAASLGANAVVLTETLGREDLPGGVRSYRAYRLADSVGRAVYTRPAEDAPRAKPVEATASPIEVRKPAEPAASSPPVLHRQHRHFEWVWARNPLMRSHRLGFDPARASKDEREQLRLYVRENFSPPEYGKLVKALGARAKVVLDFVHERVE